MMILNIHYMISLALVFVLFSTGAWKKSYSTTLLVIAITVAMYHSQQCDIGSLSHFIVNVASVFAVFRAIVHREPDRFVR